MSSAIDLTGEIINNLELLIRKRENKRTYYYCKCLKCDNEKWIRADHIRSGAQKGCGCGSQDNYFESNDLTKKKFGRLTAIRATSLRSSNGSIIWECECLCGETKNIAAYNLVSGGIRSCGCLQKETRRENMSKAIKEHIDRHIVDGTNLQVIARDKLISSNKSGITGVHYDNNRCKWVPQIEFKGNKYYLGRYDTKEDAAAIRKIAEDKLFGEFLKWYKEFKESEEENEDG